MGRVAQIKVGMEMKQNRRHKRGFAVRNVSHGLLQTFLRQFDVNVVEGWSVQVAEDVKTPQGANVFHSRLMTGVATSASAIIVDGVVGFNREAD